MGRLVRLVAVVLLLAVCRATPAGTWYVDSAVSSSGDGKSWETAFQTIQEGIDAASHGNTVIVAEGTYVENIRFNGKNVVLRSIDPSDPTVVANTIIDGNKARSVVTFTGTEGRTCVLSGFTIRNGRAAEGSGICGGTPQSHTHATIRNNVIRDNLQMGLSRCDGVIENNTISENWGDRGGGLYACSGVIRANAITANSAYWGGGLFLCHGTIENNIISGNSANEWNGGGLAECDGTIRNNVIHGNGAWIAGGGLALCDGDILNNRIESNSVVYYYDTGPGSPIPEPGGWGGGLFSCQGLVQGNIIRGNRATATYGGGRGAALSHCGGIIRNSIIWENEGDHGSGPELYASAAPTYCCIQGWTGGGEGNTARDPEFLDPDNGDFRLRPDSPCIDAGFNDPELPEIDIAGMHRIMYGGKSLTVDMGAYEYYVNEIEVGEGEDVTLTWSSLAGKGYSVYFSSDMMTWELAVEAVPSMGDTMTSWLDLAALISSPEVRRRYYRIIENR